VSGAHKVLHFTRSDNFTVWFWNEFKSQRKSKSERQHCPDFSIYSA